MESVGSRLASHSCCRFVCWARSSGGCSSTTCSELHQASGRLRFFGGHIGLSERRAFPSSPGAAVRKKRFVVYAKPPFSGPEAVLAYLSRYTHRVAISNRRLIALDEAGVTFRYKDYRRDGPDRQRIMTLEPCTNSSAASCSTFFRRGFHRIRHYGLLASGGRKANIARARSCSMHPHHLRSATLPLPDPPMPCPCCGGRMVIIEIFERWMQPRAPPHASAPSPGASPRDPARLALNLTSQHRGSGQCAHTRSSPITSAHDRDEPWPAHPICRRRSTFMTHSHSSITTSCPK